MQKINVGHFVSMAGTSPMIQILGPGLARFMYDDLKQNHGSLPSLYI